MSKLFGGGSPPPAPTIIQQTTPPPPTVDDAAKQREMKDANLRRRGRAASILTGVRGTEPPSVAVKTLTGQ